MKLSVRNVSMLAAMALVVGATVFSSHALAAHYGTVCKHFPGFDGPTLVQHAKVCATIDDHDFDDRIRGWVTYHNAGIQRVEVHVSYIRLMHFRDGDVWIAEDSGSFIRMIRADDDLHVTTPWRASPSGMHWTRTRMWVCWPDMRGKPCGSPVAWNSENVSY